MINDFRFSHGQFSTVLTGFSLTGSDVSSFLDAQTTFNIKTFDENNFHLISFLDPQGKVETYGWLVREKDKFLYLVPPLLAEQSLQRLNKFLVSEDVEISSDGNSAWTFVLGSEVSGFSGEIFEEKAVLRKYAAQNIPVIPSSDVELWRKLNGWPSFTGEGFVRELINNGRLFDLALSTKKGCYPGQETVSKIATHRGAAYSPVLVETKEPAASGTMMMSGNKIGQLIECLSWENSYYSIVTLLRDFRVEGMVLNFELEGKAFQGIVRYYPLLKGDSESKSLELYDSALTAFRNDDLILAEKNLRKSIELNPRLSDAYEALGVMLGRLERFPEAISVMEKLTEVDPDSSMAHTNLSLFLMKIGKIEEAENHKSTATLKSFKKFGEEAKVKEEAAKKLKAEQDEWARREKMFLEVLEIDPEDTLANYGLGSIAVEKSEWEKARSYLEKVIEADPKYSVAYLALGKTYKGLGLKDKAQETFRQGISVAAAKGDFMPANQMQSELDRI
jgi:tetratricopeptide (TPR) repeat protein